MTAIVPMIASVAAAFFACGRLKAGTPLEIASTPVSAVAPCENAFRRAKIVIPATRRAPCRSAPDTGITLGQPPTHSTKPTSDQHEDGDHEAVRGDREQRARLLRPPKVDQSDEHDEDQIDSNTLCWFAHGNAEPMAKHARGDRHDHRHHVVEQQRRGRDEPGEHAQVLLADDVGAAAARVGANRLPIGAHHDRHQGRDGEGDRHHVLASGSSSRASRRSGSPRMRRRPRTAHRRRRPAGPGPWATACAPGSRS